MMRPEVTVTTYQGSPRWRLEIGDEKYICLGDILNDAVYSRFILEKLGAMDCIDLSMILDEPIFDVEQPLMILCKRDRIEVLGPEQIRLD